jgi:DUF4097 and DUF4098 domain-containing protein YvlB
MTSTTCFPKTIRWNSAGTLLGALLLAVCGCGGTFTGTFEFDGEEFSIKFSLPDIATDRSTQNVDVQGVTSLKATTRNGPIRVRLDDSRSDAAIGIFKFANGKSSTEAKELLNSINVKIERTGANQEVLEITVEFPTQDQDGNPVGAGRTGASLNIRVPNGMGLDLNNENARIRVSDFAGSVKARATNAAIEMNNVTGNMDLGTDNGRVEVASSEGSVLARSGNGSIMIRAALPANGTLDAETGNGSIELRVPTSTAASLDLQTTNGLVTANFAGFGLVNDLSVTTDKLTAVLNGGGGSIRGKTTNGSIAFAGF